MRRLIILAAAVACGCSYIPGTSENRIKETERLVSRGMRDPASAQFRDVREVKLDMGGLAYCGEVNGRNAFGAYSGFRKFVVHQVDKVAIEPEPNVSRDRTGAVEALEFATLQLQVCAAGRANPVSAP